MSNMMHGMGFPFFMGLFRGPFFLIVIVVGAFFLVRRFLGPRGRGRGGERFVGGSSRADEALSGGSSGSTETSIFRLAAQRGGEITVSEVVTELGLDPKEAEKILESMNDGTRVRMEFDDKGTVYYEFPELKR